MHYFHRMYHHGCGAVRCYSWFGNLPLRQSLVSAASFPKVSSWWNSCPFLYSSWLLDSFIIFEFTWRRWSVLDCSWSKLGAQNSPTWNDVVGLARLSRSRSYQGFHSNTWYIWHSLLLLCRWRSFINLLMLNIKLLSNRLYDQTFLVDLRCRAGSAARHHQIVYTVCSTVSLRVIYEGYTMLMMVVVMIILI